MDDNPGEALIGQLENLRIRLGRSGVERTHGLREALGGDCTFYRKSLDIFLKKDYKEISDIIREVHRLSNIIEGK